MRFLVKGLLLSLLLTGCATMEQTLPVSQSVHLNQASAWPLKGAGRYLQKINAKIRGETYTFSVHLMLEDQKLEAIAFNDIYGRLYHLTWTPEKLNWECAETFSEILRSENIITDFLLAHLSSEDLHAALLNAELQETWNGNENIRLITSPSEILRRISREGSLGYLWERIRIHNPEMGYELDIQTVTLP